MRARAIALSDAIGGRGNQISRRNAGANGCGRRYTAGVANVNLGNGATGSYVRNEIRSQRNKRDKVSVGTDHGIVTGPVARGLAVSGDGDELRNGAGRSGGRAVGGGRGNANRTPVNLRHTAGNRDGGDHVDGRFRPAAIGGISVGAETDHTGERSTGSDAQTSIL